VVFGVGVDIDLILLLKAAFLGVIEGLTEFLPISSTGHLIIVGDLLNFNDDKGKVFEIAIQLAAILAVMWAYRQKIMTVTWGMTQGESNAWRFATNLMIAFLPAAVLGLLFHSAIKTLLWSPLTVAVALIIGGVVILLVERHIAKVAPRIHSVDDMRWQDALKVGMAQSVALIPGTSRSGATIMGGLIFGLSRTAATEFSFFLAIPTMIAATVYDVYKNWALFNVGDLPIFVVGFVMSFIAAMIAVKALLSFVASHSFVAFAWYRIVFGVIVLWYFWS
jgi:undecaprenyl-diphosphatase